MERSATALALHHAREVRHAHWQAISVPDRGIELHNGHPLPPEPKPPAAIYHPPVVKKPIIVASHTWTRWPDIVNACAEMWGLPTEAFLGRSRKAQHVRVRQVIVYLARMLTTLSLTQIGHRIGNDHTTTLYTCRKMRQRLEAEPELRACINLICVQLGVSCFVQMGA